MIPLRDNVPSRTTSWVNYLILGVTSLAFLGQLSQPQGGDPIVEKYGMIPARVLDPDEPVRITEVRQVGVRVVERERVLASPEFTPWLTLVTCMFLHGGWMHFLGNMWFLYIFGDNVEDRLGHFGYLAFYLICGIAGSVAHLVTNADSPIPTIGASGAIAGVMGAYLLLYSDAQVLTLVPIFYFLRLIVLPAWIFLGLWFLLQFVQGTMAMTAMQQEASVAWWAHIGGFVAGFAGVFLLKTVRMLHPAVQSRRTPSHPVEFGFGRHRHRRW